MEQKTEASQAVDERNAVIDECIAALTTHLGRSSRVDVVERNAIFGCREVVAALKAQLAPTEAQGGRLLELFKHTLGSLAMHDSAEAERIGKLYRQAQSSGNSGELQPSGNTGELAQGGDSARLSIPVSAYLWLMGAGGDAFAPPLRAGAFWWRDTFNQLAGVDMMEIIRQDRARASAETGGVK